MTHKAGERVAKTTSQNVISSLLNAFVENELIWFKQSIDLLDKPVMPKLKVLK